MIERRRRMLLCWLACGCVEASTGVAQTTEKSTMNVSASGAGPVDLVQATRIAEQALATTAPSHHFVILADQTVQRDFGWVFFYAPQRYLQTRDPKDLVPGNGPLVVYRSGRTEYLPTSVPAPAAITELERRLANPRN